MMIWDNVGRHFGKKQKSNDSGGLHGVCGGPLDSVNQNNAKMCTFMTFLGAQEDNFWDNVGAKCSNLSFVKRLFVIFVSDSKKAVKMELPKGGGYEIRQCLCMFRKGRASSFWLHFGLHF